VLGLCLGLGLGLVLEVGTESLFGLVSAEVWCGAVWRGLALPGLGLE